MQETYEGPDISGRLIGNFREIGHTMRHISEGKGSQKRILTILREVGTISQSELTQRLGVQPGSASEVIGKLETAGLITRVPNPADRRTLDISLTPAGAAQVEEIITLREQRHKEMFSCLSPEEQATLLSLLEKVSEDWKIRYPRRNPK